MFSFRPLGLTGLFFMLLLAAIGPPPPVEADSRLDDSVPLSQDQAAAMLEALREIRQSLENIQRQGAAAPVGARTPTTATVDMRSDRPVIGADDAPVTVVEFTDYQCPFCRRFAHSTFPLLKRDYIDSGKVRWQVRDLPLNFHKDARHAAQAALCAGEQQKFWKMRDSLFRNSASLGQAQLRTYAAELKLEMPAFNDCVSSGRYLPAIDRDVAAAGQMRITGTPTFVIGRTHAEEMTGTLLVGAQSPAVFSAQIERALALE